MLSVFQINLTIQTLTDCVVAESQHMMLCIFYLLTAVFNFPSVLYLPTSVKSVLYEK